MKLAYKLSFLLLALYFLTRLFNLFSLPLFLDESLYLRMSQDIVSKNHIWVSFTDGKEPLFFWLLALFIKGISPAIVAGRLLSVLSGSVTLLGVFIASKKLFNLRTAFIASVLFVFSPFTFFYHRLALLDSFLVMLMTWACVFFVLSFSKKSHYLFLTLTGIFWGLALLTKTLAQVYFLTFLATIIIYGVWQKQINAKNILSFGIIIFLVSLIYFPLRLAPGFSQIANKNTIFAYPVSFAISHPQIILIANLKSAVKDWWPDFFGLPALIAFALTSILILRSRKLLLLYALVILPFVGESFIAKIYFPRYLLFSSIPFFIIVAFGLREIIRVNRKLGYLSFLLVFVIPCLSFANLLFFNNPAVLPEIEKWQYYYGWPSGSCMQLPGNYLSSKLTNAKITVLIPNAGVGEALKQKFYRNNQLVLLENQNSTMPLNYIVRNYYQSQTAIAGKQVVLGNDICQQSPKLYEL